MQSVVIFVALKSKYCLLVCNCA